ncbi:M15 family metallopeptidase [filamentous cyanobacterium LEGE 11480]|uniref:M15 family metallopeptidase n=2 Tax=Romeriopsis TaxID=2992131 RepID=A0A928Z4T5_9CYAN|nr:M15 family metallopeptidase [Romeriopsis navalis LEGE 11480]
MHRETAQAFRQMVADAERSGAYIVPVSGFRGVSLQGELFENQIARKGSIQRAALVSAPPGHSEHHTGYAIDIGDADNPGTHVEMSFEQTPSFRWLNQNAPRYGFELSFPLGNRQGISYEPWHWRYVGSSASANVFAVARNL